jgi:ATP-dependent helicase/nuclease subunit A
LDIGREDAQARILAQTEFSVPLALEAGAGTGKTAILTARLISWSLGPGWVKAQRELEHGPGVVAGHGLERIAARVLGRVAAVTFTEAAAAEMGTKVAETLSELEAGGVPLALDPQALPAKKAICQERARALLASLDQLMVQTIHAFCLRLLARFPLEAKIHPLVSVDPEGMLMEEIARELVEPLLASSQGTTQQEDLLALLQEGKGPQEIMEALVSLAQEGICPEALREPFFSRSRILWMKQELERSLDDFLAAGGASLGGAGKRPTAALDVLEAVKRTRDTLGRLCLDTPQELDLACGGIKDIWEGGPLERLGKWARGKFNRAEEKALEASSPGLVEEASGLYTWLKTLCRMRPLLLNRAASVLAQLLEELYREMRSRGVLSFGGILREARQLLVSNSQVLSQVRLSMDQLLVDEFQDTDSLQCEIIRMIALEGPQEQRPGLFIVGDPKQSIYGWRDADLAAYEAFLQELERKGGRRLLLGVNFRSAPPILLEVERAIGPIMKRSEGLQPEFQPLIPCEGKEHQEGFSSGAWSPVEYWMVSQLEALAEGGGASTGKLEATELEAMAVAHDIWRLHHEAGVAWSSIGILLRSTGDLDVYLGAFKEAGVPYWVSSDRNYFRRREILEATALVRTILDPTDQLALVSYLRSCAVGVPDAAWIPLWTRDFPRLMAQLRGEDPPLLEQIRQLVTEVSLSLPPEIPGMDRIPGWESSLLAAVDWVARLRQSYREEPLDSFIQHILEWTLLEATEAARYLGSYRLANLERFFGSLLSCLQKAPGGTQAVLRMLRCWVSRQREAEEATPPEAVEEAVQVMTIHRAKGLDFSHVYLVQVHKSTRQQSSSQTRVERVGQDWECSLFGWPSPGYWRVEHRVQEVSLAEMVRTLYVAMTRAKDRLVITGNWEGRSGPSQLTYAELLKKRAGGIPSPSTLRGACTQKDPWGGLREHTGVIWKAPAMWPIPSRAASPETRPWGIPPVEELARQAKELRGLKDRALERMERPWQEAMSRKAHLALEDDLALGRETGAKDEDGLRRNLAMELGKIVHGALERVAWTGDFQEEMAGLERWCREQVLRVLSGDEASQALRRLEAIWGGLRGGHILRRLQQIGPHVVARELPVLLAPFGDQEGPVGVFAGFMDLLYRDPKDGKWVVADYKTDRVGSPQEMLELCKVYSSQGELYVRAIQEMMGLAQPPRFELWFLSADEIQEVAVQFAQNPEGPE